MNCDGLSVNFSNPLFGVSFSKRKLKIGFKVSFLWWMPRLQIFPYGLLVSYWGQVKSELMPGSEDSKCVGLFISLGVPVISVSQPNRKCFKKSVSIGTDN